MSSSADPAAYRPAFPPPPPTPVTPATRAFPVHEESTLRFGEQILRDDRAGTAPAARFDVDLRRSTPLPPDELVEARAAAESAGYAAGWAQGRREAKAAAEAQADRDAVAAEDVLNALTEQVERTMTAMATAATRLEQQALPAIHELEHTIIGAAFELAQAILGRELRTAAEPGRDALARALALAPVQRPVTVRLNPADRMSIGTTELVVDGRAVTLVSDTSLRPGDAIAVCDATTIDARLGPAVERVREVLELQ
jgi:flagellar assembly protein FliH